MEYEQTQELHWYSYQLNKFSDPTISLLEIKSLLFQKTYYIQFTLHSITLCLLEDVGETDSSSLSTHLSDKTRRVYINH